MQTNKPTDEGNIVRLMFALTQCQGTMDLYRALDRMSVVDIHHIKTISELVLSAKTAKGVQL